MKDLYISFDSYYTIKEYNAFLTASKNNNIEIEEYLRIRPPFKRFLKLKEGDLPKFLNFDVATTSDRKWLVSLVKPVQPNEEYLLKRREGKDNSYWNYILPRELENAHKQDYIMFFKAMDFTEISLISKSLPKTKIFKLGKSKLKKYNIFYCFNPYIRGLLRNSSLLMEFGREARVSLAVKHDTNVPNNPGDLEYYLNEFILVREKLEDKTYESEYYLDGKVHPLKRTEFI